MGIKVLNTNMHAFLQGGPCIPLLHLESACKTDKIILFQTFNDFEAAVLMVNSEIFYECEMLAVMHG